MGHFGFCDVQLNSDTECMPTRLTPWSAPTSARDSEKHVRRKTVSGAPLNSQTSASASDIHKKVRRKTVCGAALKSETKCMQTRLAPWFTPTSARDSKKHVRRKTSDGLVRYFPGKDQFLQLNWL